MTILPKTKVGKSSLILFLSSIFVIFLGSSSSNTIYKNISGGNTILEDLTIRPMLVVFVLLGFVFCSASFIFGLFSLFKKKERSIFVIITTILGALVNLFILGEIFGHE